MTVRSCPGCGGRLSGDVLVCRSCWYGRIPAELREEFREARRVGDIVIRRKVAAEIIRHAIRTRSTA